MRCFSSHPKVHQRHSARAGWFRGCTTGEVTGLVSLTNVLLGETRRVLRWRPQRHAHSRAMLPCYRVIACYATAVVLERAHAEGCSQLRRLVTGKVNVLQTVSARHVSARHALALRASARARACCHQHYAPAPDAASRSRAARCRTRCSAATSCAVCMCALCQRCGTPARCARRGGGAARGVDTAAPAARERARNRPRDGGERRSEQGLGSTRVRSTVFHTLSSTPHSLPPKVSRRDLPSMRRWPRADSRVTPSVRARQSPRDPSFNSRSRVIPAPSAALTLPPRRAARRRRPPSPPSSSERSSRARSHSPHRRPPHPLS